MRTAALVVVSLLITTSLAGQWRASTGLTPRQSLAGIAIARNESTVFAVGSDGSFWRSADGGLRWRAVGREFYGVFTVHVDPIDADVAYIAGGGGFVWTTDDSGETWSRLPATDGYPLVATITSDPHDGSTLYAIRASGRDAPQSPSAILKSINAGRTWSAFVVRAADVAVDPFDSNVIYAAWRGDGGTGGLAKSVDGGHTWSFDLFANPYTTVNSITMDPHVPNVIYTTVSASLGDDVRVSRDGGRTWTDVPVFVDGLKVRVLRVIVNPRNSNELFIASDFEGVVRSLDGGRTWRTMNEGLPSTYVRALAISPSGSFLLAAVDRTVYRLELVGRRRRATR